MEQDVKKATVVDDLKDITVEEKSFFLPIQVSLPSKGKLYDEKSSLHKVEYLELRGMTAREEDILTSRAYIRSGTALDKVLKSCITDRNIDLDDLLIGDKNTLLVALRIESYGTDYRINITCPDCNEKQEYTFSLSEAELKILSAESLEEYKNLFEMQLPKSKAVVKFKLLTSRDDREITELREALKKKAGIVEENLITSRMFKQIISVNGNEDRNYISKFVQTLPILDSKAFREYVRSIEPDVSLKCSFTCSSCGFKDKIDVPITLEFFWPTGNR
jgi:RNase P subunit RPR2